MIRAELVALILLPLMSGVVAGSAFAQSGLERSNREVDETAGSQMVESGYVETLIEALVAAPDFQTRRDRLLAELGNPNVGADMAGRLGTAIAVIGQLERTNRTDPSLIRMFLRASLAADPALREQAVIAASTNGDPPIPGAGAKSSPFSEADEGVSNPSVEPLSTATTIELTAKLREYKQRRLVRDQLNTISVGTYNTGMTATTGVQSINTWGIYDGGGAPFTTRLFATTIGDQAMLDRLDAQMRSARRGAVALGVGGALTTVATFALIVNFAGSDDSWPIVAGGLVGGFGGTALLIAPFVPSMVKNKQQWVARYYTIQEADKAIKSFNAELCEELGLKAEDVLDIDLQQSRRTGIRVQPWVGVLAMGVSGTF